MAASRGAQPALRIFAALLIAAVAGCAAGGAALRPVSDGTIVPEAIGAVATVSGAEGQPLALSHWPADGETRAVIVGVHGYGDYGPSTFARAAEAWAGRGIETYAYDQDGFGRNPTRGQWRGAAGLVEDLRAVVRGVRGAAPCRPIVVVGHSMGGGVALAAAPRLLADGIVLAAPAIWGGAALNPFHRASAWLVAMVAPDHRFTGRGIVEIQPSDNIEMLIGLGRDPLHLGQPSARELLGLVRVVDLAEAAVPEVRLPSLLLLGARDDIVPNARVREIHERLPGPGAAISYPNGWHMLLRDLQAETVWSDVADWTLARTPPATCSETQG